MLCPTVERRCKGRMTWPGLAERLSNTQTHREVEGGEEGRRWRDWSQYHVGHGYMSHKKGIVIGEVEPHRPSLPLGPGHPRAGPPGGEQAEDRGPTARPPEFPLAGLLGPLLAPSSGRSTVRDPVIPRHRLPLELSRSGLRRIA
ncbi:unnamed protein product [Protopolystoma xenopodis]|uniref:Uncharacterized protein n=1 Tax=Protopolystoma xenopodis TaxID=117903 RepID=A0A3S5ALX6_9PLAT|nr:unnamed protein product [Protopolystoma xenopodis]